MDPKNLKAVDIEEIDDEAMEDVSGGGDLGCDCFCGGDDEEPASRA
jgi:hypothetical protein